MVSALVLACSLLAPAVAEEAARGAVHALLINGGSGPNVNYQSHLHHLEDMVALLERRGLSRERIHVFSADGEDDAPDLIGRSPRPDRFWLIDGTRLGERLRPRSALTSTSWEGMRLRPATHAALQAWFEKEGRLLAPGDRLLLFVTDHGSGNEKDLDNGSISLWKQDLTVRDLDRLVARLPDRVRTVMIMSQCFSGTFASLIYPDSSTEPSGDRCGFFSTARDLRAYGCYQEGRDQDRIGHAFRFIEALGRHETTNEAHLEVLITDATPDSPLRTSDVYLERLVAERAEELELKPDVLADLLLAKAWQDRGARESEIRLLDRIGTAFGTFSPRSLAELEAYESELPQLIDRVAVYYERWDPAFVSAKDELLRNFAEARPAWRKRLDDERVKRLDVKQRKQLMQELLPALDEHARGRPELWQRLERLREKVRGAGELGWRLEARIAATRRLRTILMSIAGRVLLESEAEQTRRRALEQLEQCEAFAPGSLAAGGDSPAREPEEPFPTLQADLKRMEEILPSWLGVGYAPIPDLLADRQLSSGASFLETVFPGSPAHEAGLEVGDIVLGPPGRPFSARQHFREWTMMSPRGTPLLIRVLRPGATVDKDRTFETTLLLRASPLEVPELPGPPVVGEAVPPLPSSLEPVGRPGLADFRGSRPRVIFFWATWCEPCKMAVPEILAFAEARGYQVLAISDEDADTVAGFLETREEPFFELVAVDAYRRSFVSHGVSGTPTILVVDEKGVVIHRQMGYDPAAGLTVGGWDWSGR